MKRSVIFATTFLLFCDLSLFAQDTRVRWLTSEQALKEAKQTGKCILVNVRQVGNPSDSLLVDLVSKDAFLEAYLTEHFVVVNVDEEHNSAIEFSGRLIPAKNFCIKVFGGAATGSANIFSPDKRFVGYLSGYTDPQYVYNVLRYCVEKLYITQGIREYVDDCNRLRAGKKLFPWHSYEEGMALARQSHKKVLINAFGWFSGYCRRMRDVTYADPEIAGFINDFFIPIQIDMDAVGPLRYGDREMRPLDFLSNVLKVTGYPSTLFYDSDGTRLGLVSGSHKPEVFLYILNFYAKEDYRNETLESYLDKRGVSEQK